MTYKELKELAGDLQKQNENLSTLLWLVVQNAGVPVQEKGRKICMDAAEIGGVDRFVTMAQTSLKQDAIARVSIEAKNNNLILTAHKL